jgi:hypothetical protein
MLEKAEHARRFYIEYLRQIRAVLKSGARVEPDVLLNRGAAFTDPPPIMIDVGEFGPEWVSKMRTLLSSPVCRAERLQSYRALLGDFERSALAASAAHFGDISDGRAFSRTAAHLRRVFRLRAGIARLKLNEVMYRLHVRTAADFAAEALDSLESLQAIFRPPASLVIPIR